MKKSFYNMEFPYNDSTILLNTMTGSVLLLNSDEYQRYSSDTSSEDEKRTLSHYGFYINEWVDEKMLVDKARDFATTCRRPYFRILPTTACNAQCSYCFERGMTISQMTPEICKATVKFIDSVVEQNDRVSVTWFGGEPLLAVTQIDFMSNALRDVFLKKNISPKYGIITNGSLITTEIAHKMKFEWGISHIQITVDAFGSQYNAIKNYKQPERYNFMMAIRNIGYVLEHGLNVSVRMNYDGNNAESLIELISFLHRQFSTPQGTLMQNLHLYLSPVWSSNSNNGKMKYQQTNKAEDNYLKVVKFLLKMGDIPLKQLVNIKLTSSVCSARNAYGYSILPNGDLVKCCEAYDEIVGNIYNGVTADSLLKFWISDSLETECKTCKLLPMCQGGCKAAYHRSLSRCKLSYADLHKIMRLYADEYMNTHAT